MIYIFLIQKHIEYWISKLAKEYKETRDFGK